MPMRRPCKDRHCAADSSRKGWPCSQAWPPCHCTAAGSNNQILVWRQLLEHLALTVPEVVLAILGEDICYTLAWVRALNDIVGVKERIPEDSNVGGRSRIGQDRAEQGNRA